MESTSKELLTRLQDMNEYEFEELVADLWEEQGWNTTVTSGSNDCGIDVIAEKHSPFYEKQLIQAKRYSSDNKVGSPDIQKYSSLKLRDDVDAVIVVTTGNFTNDAKDIAREFNVKTIDGHRLVLMIHKFGVDKLTSEYIDLTQEKNFEQTYSDFAIIKLNDAIQTSKNNSITVTIRLYLAGFELGYMIHPKIGKNYNIHKFYNPSSTVNEFCEEDWEKIKSVSSKNDLEMLETDKDKMVVGNKEGEIPESGELRSLMTEFLSGVISISPGDIEIVVEKSERGFDSYSSEQ